MKNWKLVPKNTKVAKYVECYWFLEKEQCDVGNNHPKLNPDPFAHLILSSQNHKFHYEQNNVAQKGDGSHFIFPHLNTFTMDHSNPFLIIGIKFKLGGLYSLQSQLPSFKLDKITAVEINKSHGLQSLNVESLLHNAVIKPQEVCDTLDEMLEPWLMQNREDKHSKLVRDIFPLLGTTPIAQMGKALHRSQRTIERSFLKVTHLTLKQYQSMNRLENILNYLYKLDDEAVDWADLAAKFEFSDQPHLIRYLKSSLGKTPGEYAKHRDLTIDIYGDFDFS